MIRRILHAAAATARTTSQWAQRPPHSAARRFLASAQACPRGPAILSRAAVLAAALAAPMVLGTAIVAAEPAAASSASLEAVGSASSASASATDAHLIAAEDLECPWCAAMRAGPCAAEFTRWRNCSKAIQMQERAEAEAAQRQQQADAAAAQGQPSASASAPGPLPSAPSRRSRASVECMPAFKLMDACVRTPGPKRDYYRQILPLDDRQPTAEEKIRDAQSD